MHKEFFSFVDRIAERLPETDVGFTTNGHLVTKRITEQVLSREAITRINVSLEELPWEDAIAAPPPPQLTFDSAAPSNNASGAAAARKAHESARAEYLQKKRNGDIPKRPRRKKDKTKPKRAMSAYLFFTKAKRPQAKSKLGKDAKVTAVMKELAAMWKKCSAKDRKKYEADAKKARASYMVAIEEWRKNKKTQKKEPKKVKKSTTKKSSDKGLRV